MRTHRVTPLLLVLIAALLTAARAATAAAQPVRVTASDTLASLVAGGNATCVTTTSGAGYCWGGLGTASGDVHRLMGEDGRIADFVAVAPDAFNRCALTRREQVWCDRSSLMGQETAGAIPGGPFRAVTTGFDHACALTRAGAAFCWGRNGMGQLGNGGAGAGGPTEVVGEHRFAQLSAGELLTCGVTRRDGAVYCWGYGQSGQTGDSSIMTPCIGAPPAANRPCSTAVPVRVRPESLGGSWSGAVSRSVRFTRVDAGRRLACGVTSDGDAWCWGNNYRCALGRCRAPDSPRARHVQLPGRVVEVEAGYWHACARTADGRVFCWGDNNTGQLGSLVTANAGADGQPPDHRDTSRAGREIQRADPCFGGGRCSPVPVEVAPGRRWAALAVGASHACALDADDGGIHCWGGTDSTALGANARLVPCPTRSEQWKDARCQPTPVRVPGLPPLAARREPAVGPSAPTRVRVSREEVRIEFPRDTARAWGWSGATEPSYRAEYVWGVTVDAIGEPQTLMLRAGRTDRRARDFPSLDSLVATGSASRCTGGMIATCLRGQVATRVVGGAVTLVIRDSAAIRELFGLRPATVRAWRQEPEQDHGYEGEIVRVEYVAPQVPAPSPAMLAESDRLRRAHAAAIRSNSRAIVGTAEPWGPLWLAVGDTMPLRVEERQCTYDVCTMGWESPVDSGWTVEDPSVVALDAPPIDTAARRLRGPNVVGVRLVARRPGRTTVSVRGLHSPLDTMPSRTSPASALSRPVVVTPPIGRVEIEPLPDTVQVGARIPVRARVLDRAGAPLEGLPVTLLERGGPYGRVHALSRDATLTFDGAPGRRTLIASFAGRADTAYVHVVARPAP